jgi:outer membrane protein
MMIGTVRAEFIGLNIDNNRAPPALSGSLMGSNHASIDLVDDLGVEDPAQSSMVLILEHPISALPNVRYSEFNLDSRGTSTLDTDVSLKGSSFASGDQIRSSFDLSQNDIVLYYQLGDTSVDLDLGVDLKRFDGQISMSGGSSASVDVDETIPMLYLSARYNWRNTGFYIGADINSSIIDLGFSESSAEDTTIKLGYESDAGLGVEGGYKYYSLELDGGNSLATDLKYDGLFLNGYFNF